MTPPTRTAPRRRPPAKTRTGLTTASAKKPKARAPPWTKRWTPFLAMCPTNSPMLTRRARTTLQRTTTTRRKPPPWSTCLPPPRARTTPAKPPRCLSARVDFVARPVAPPPFFHSRESGNLPLLAAEGGRFAPPALGLGDSRFRGNGRRGGNGEFFNFWRDGE